MVFRTRIWKNVLMLLMLSSYVWSLIFQGVQSLMSQESALVSIQERYIQLESGIEQRLKWAAGANPTLGPVLKHFEQAIADRKTLLEVSWEMAPRWQHLWM
jgi:biopolymer transport protein ExbB/TolQ